MLRLRWTDATDRLGGYLVVEHAGLERVGVPLCLEVTVDESGRSVAWWVTSRADVLAVMLGADA